jgi:putative oxidoreductase
MSIACEWKEDTMDAALLIARFVFGLLIAVHGSQKLFGWFGGPGLSGTAAFLAGLGFRPGRLFAVANALTECGAGVLLALGLFQPAAAAAIISVMIVAIATVHWRNGLLALTNGVELPLLYLTAALSLALTGPGDYSLDAVLGLHEWWTPPLTALVLVAGVLGGFASLVMRRPAPAVVHA